MVSNVLDLMFMPVKLDILEIYVIFHYVTMFLQTVHKCAAHMEHVCLTINASVKVDGKEMPIVLNIRVKFLLCMVPNALDPIFMTVKLGTLEIYVIFHYVTMFLQIIHKCVVHTEHVCLTINASVKVDGKETPIVLNFHVMP